MKRAAIICPGRGSYTEASLGSLPKAHHWVQRAEELRAAYELPALLELDRAAKFRPALHLRPANVSPLIYVATMLDAAQVRASHDVVCVLGNSLGWYTSLAVADALSFDDGFRLVQEVALAQESHRGGGQILYPLVGEDWVRDAEREVRVASALAAAAGEAFASIELGGYVVLAGSDLGLKQLENALPSIKVGATTYPFRLAQHGPYHTPLLADVAMRARERLSDLSFRKPHLTLIDGRGVRFTPWSASGTELGHYTLGTQITETFSLTRGVRVALREHAPDLLVLPGPGNTLGGVCGQILIEEGWRGIHRRADFDQVQASDRPAVWSMRR